MARPAKKRARLAQQPSSFGFLPQDLVMEILKRLPVESILRLKCVCRSWYAIFSDPYFINLHLLHSKKKPGTLVFLTSRVAEPVVINMYTCHQRITKAKLLFDKVLPGPPGDVWISPPLHCDGLVLITSTAEMFVCNPSTGECLTLPEGSFNHLPHHTGEDRVGFCFDSRSNKYKVVRNFYYCDGYEDGHLMVSLGFEVLTLGSNAWEPVDDYPPVEIAVDCTPASVDGAVYWFDESWNDLVCFDVEENKFSVLDRPHSSQPDVVLYISNLEGSLCFLRHFLGNGTTEIWILSKDRRGGAVWTQSCSINVENSMRYIVPVKMSNGKVLFQSGTELWWYCSRKKRFKKVADFQKDVWYYNPKKYNIQTFAYTNVNILIGSYVESLIKIGAC